MQLPAASVIISVFACICIAILERHSSFFCKSQRAERISFAWAQSAFLCMQLLRHTYDLLDYRRCLSRTSGSSPLHANLSSCNDFRGFEFQYFQVKGEPYTRGNRTVHSVLQLPLLTEMINANQYDRIFHEKCITM